MVNNDPFSGLDNIARSIFGRTPTAFNSLTPQFMPMDVYKKEDKYIITADLPGVEPSSIDLDYDNGILTISAKRASEKTDEGTDWITNERFAGAYRRQVSVSDSIDSENITASYDNGVLSISLPLIEKAKARKIEVDHSKADGSKTIEG